jgi:hypothetical protein
MPHPNHLQSILSHPHFNSISLLHPQDYETRACEFLYPLYMDELCVVVKKARRIPSILLPLVVFDENIWLSLFSAGILIGIVWSLLRFINNVMKRPSDFSERVEFYMNSYNFSHFQAHQSQLRQYSQVFMDSWLILLSVPMRRFTRVQNERLFVASVCLISMIFVSMYQSLITTVFVRPLYFKDINSLSQLDKSGVELNVKYAGYLTDVFPRDSTDLFRSLSKKMKLVETNVSAMDLVKNNKNVATITRKSTVHLDNFEYFVKKQLHLIDKECPKNYFVAYMLPVHSTFFDTFNRILFDIHRFGFIQKWISDINFEATLTNMKSFEDEATHSKVLSIEDFKLPFLVLLGGNSCGGVVFALEFLIWVCWRSSGMVEENREKFEDSGEVGRIEDDSGNVEASETTEEVSEEMAEQQVKVEISNC